MVREHHSMQNRYLKKKNKRDKSMYTNTHTLSKDLSLIAYARVITYKKYRKENSHGLGKASHFRISQIETDLCSQIVII